MCDARTLMYRSRALYPRAARRPTDAIRRICFDHRLTSPLSLQWRQGNTGLLRRPRRQPNAALPDHICVHE